MKPLWLVYTNKVFGEDSVGVIFKNGDGKYSGFYSTKFLRSFHLLVILLYLKSAYKCVTTGNQEVAVIN